MEKDLQRILSSYIYSCTLFFTCNESITSVLVPTLFYFDEKFAKVKLNEAEMCSLVCGLHMAQYCEN